MEHQILRLGTGSFAFSRSQGTSYIVLNDMFLPIDQHANLQHFIGLFIEVGILIRLDIMMTKRKRRMIMGTGSFVAVFLDTLLSQGVSDEIEHRDQSIPNTENAFVD